MSITCSTCGAATDLLARLVSIKLRYHTTDPVMLQQRRDLDALAALAEFLKCADAARDLLKREA